MKISKVKVVLKYLTGGVESVVEYILDLFNEMVAKLPAEEVAKYAQLAKDVSVFVGNLCVLIKSEDRRDAAQATAQCFSDLATALLDSKLSKEELDGIVAAVKSAVEDWRKVR